jgi:8-hydroxy-5-deazaflavin:NADPH oxidoreductase
MKIGVIGSGHIGSTVGKLLAHAGHEVFFSSRHPERLKALVDDVGAKARAGSIEDAARYGEVILLAVPFHALPELGKLLAPLLAGKVVLETANPYPDRDGSMAQEIIDSGHGTGPQVQDWFPGTRIVRAFNSVSDQTLIKQAHRAEPQLGIPLASNDLDALQDASKLVRDAGFDAVIVGGLSRSKDFDVGTAVYNSGLSGPALRKALHLP